ncbi:MAG: hypothetical protein ACLQVG_17615 [Terriglobia bacterium]
MPVYMVQNPSGENENRCMLVESDSHFLALVRYVERRAGAELSQKWSNSRAVAAATTAHGALLAIRFPIP